MLNTNTILLKQAFILFFLFLGIHAFAYAQVKSDANPREKKNIQTTLTDCNLDIPIDVRLLNPSITLSYAFNVNERGEAIDIKKVQDDFIGEEVVKTCISDWEINGLPDKSQFTVRFVWIKEKDWIRQEITGKGFNQVMIVKDQGLETISHSKVFPFHREEVLKSRKFNYRQMDY